MALSVLDISEVNMKKGDLVIANYLYRSGSDITPESFVGVVLGQSKIKVNHDEGYVSVLFGDGIFDVHVDKLTVCSTTSDHKNTK